jgi:transcription elongation factor GreA
MVLTDNTQIKKTFLTERGFEKLNNELEFLRNTKRPEIAKSLRDAADDNDLAENNEYMLIKYEQSIVEGRINELERLLCWVEIITPGSDQGTIRLGSTVTVQEDTYPSETFTIVGTAEANSRNSMISDASPLGKSLLKHQVGDVVEVRTPDGLIKYKILSVS